MKNFSSIMFVLLLMFFSSPTFSQTIGGPPGGKMYDQRLCSVRPGSQGTECTVEHPEGLCTTLRRCS